MLSIVLMMLAAGSVVQQSDAAFSRFRPVTALLGDEAAAEALVVPPILRLTEHLNAEREARKEALFGVRGGVPRMREGAPSMARRAAIGAAALAAAAPALAEEATAEAPAKEATAEAPAKAAKSASSKPIPFRYVNGKDFKAKKPEGLGALSKAEVKKKEAALKQGKVVVPTTDSDGKPFLEGEEARAIIKNSGARTFNDLAEGPQSGGSWKDDLLAKRRLTERLNAERAARKEAQR